MHFKLSSAICFNLDQSKISLSGNGLRLMSVDNYSDKLPNATSLKHYFVNMLHENAYKVMKYESWYFQSDVVPQHHTNDDALLPTDFLTHLRAFYDQ